METRLNRHAPSWEGPRAACREAERARYLAEHGESSGVMAPDERLEAAVRTPCTEHARAGPKLSRKDGARRHVAWRWHTGCLAFDGEVLWGHWSAIGELRTAGWARKVRSAVRSPGAAGGAAAAAGARVPPTVFFCRVRSSLHFQATTDSTAQGDDDDDDDDDGTDPPSPSPPPSPHATPSPVPLPDGTIPHGGNVSSHPDPTAEAGRFFSGGGLGISMSLRVAVSSGDPSQFRTGAMRAPSRPTPCLL